VSDAGPVTVDNPRLPGKLKAQTGVRSTDLVRRHGQSRQWLLAQIAIIAAQPAPLNTATVDGSKLKPASLLTAQTTSKLAPMLAIRQSGASHSNFIVLVFIFGLK
jgi:hypothetical protein